MQAPVPNTLTAATTIPETPRFAHSGFRAQPLDESIERIKSSRIMIVDDDPLLVRIVKRYLQSAGYQEFITVTDAREAVVQINRHAPDLVLLDIMMPYVNGLDIMRARLSIAGAQHTPFIILSASSDSETKSTALELGATEFLNKPVDPSDLTVRVRNALLVKAHQDIMKTETGRRFDPAVVEAFLRRLDDIERIRGTFAD